MITYFEELQVSKDAIKDNGVIDDERKILSNLFQSEQGTYNFKNVVIQQRPQTYSLLEVKFGFFEQYQTMPGQVIPWLS